MSRPDAAAAPPLLDVRGLSKLFALPLGLGDRLMRRTPHWLRAVDDVSLYVRRGETLGVIGESGCGKSTLGRTILKLHEPSGGAVIFDGADVAPMTPAQFRPLRKRMQIIFQDPYASLNPRRTVAEIVGLPLRLHEGLSARDAEARVAQFLPRVGLTERHLRRYPHQFSGGQRQRVGIARALILNPDFVVCDEPVSALDVSIQAQIIELLQEFKAQLGLTYLFISHDLAVVGRICERVAVMYLGEIVETGGRAAVLRAPAHPYTRALMAAAPRLHARRGEPPTRLKGDLPSPLAPPSGCRFHTRCPVAMDKCAGSRPPRVEVSPGHVVACHLYGETT
jgi:oligopeptide/dipeptide ABC transporter ATP-binding protein